MKRLCHHQIRFVETDLLISIISIIHHDDPSVLSLFTLRYASMNTVGHFLAPRPVSQMSIRTAAQMFVDFYQSHHMSSVCSGPSGPERGPEHFCAAQADQQQPVDVRPGRHQLPDDHLRRPGAGAQRPGQRASLRRHVSQLAAECLRHVCFKA